MTAAEMKAFQFPVAYFSMEIALDPAMPTYSGGLGILAGDMLHAAADLGVSMVAVTLLHRKGYFRQRLDSYGNQTESPQSWDPNQFLEALSPTVTVVIEGRQVQVRAWRYLLHGNSSHDVPVVYLEEYDMSLGKQMCAGVDLWLNSPQKPQEASGTSGMKAAFNGIPSLSVPDGWWVEGVVEGVTGWAIGECYQCESDTAQETASLYDKLEKGIMPMFYQEPEAYGEVMRYAIALNASYFNAQRMLLQYLDAYPRPQQPDSALT